MVGSMKAYFAERTPSQTLTDARDELLFFIRTTMSSGAYESAQVRKVIYIEDLSVGVIHSNPPPNAQQVLVWQENSNDTGSSSLITGAVVALSMIFVGLLGFLFMSRGRRRGRGITLQQFPPSEIEDIVQEVEEESNGVDVESVWQKALNAYDNEDAKVADPTDLVNNDAARMDCKDSPSMDPEGVRFEPHTSVENGNKAAASEEMEEATPMPVSVESGNVGENKNETNEPIDEKESRIPTSDKEIDSEGNQSQEAGN